LTVVVNLLMQPFGHRRVSAPARRR
jgi:hypothetical protein